MKGDEGGEIRPLRDDLEGGSFDDLAVGLSDGTITRAQAIKLAGAALLGGALTVLWADEADARNRRRRKKRRRRRKAQVTPNPVTLLTGVPAVLSVINPGDQPLTIGGFQLLGGDGTWGNIQDLPDVTIQVDDPNTILPENVGQVTLTVTDPDVVADAEGLRLVDASDTPITVVDENGIPVSILENGVQVGTGYIDVA